MKMKFSGNIFTVSVVTPNFKAQRSNQCMRINIPESSIGKLILAPYNYRNVNYSTKKRTLLLVQSSIGVVYLMNIKFWGNICPKNIIFSYQK